MGLEIFGLLMFIIGDQPYTGDKPETAAENAKTVMAIQTRLANASKSPVELRNPEARYNKKTLAQLSEMTPNFSWTSYMTTRGVPPVDDRRRRVRIPRPQSDHVGHRLDA